MALSAINVKRAVSGPPVRAKQPAAHITHLAHLCAWRQSSANPTRRRRADVEKLPPKPQRALPETYTIFLSLKLALVQPTTSCV